MHVCVSCPTTVIPHVTDAIQEWVERVAQIPVAQDQQRPDVCVIEVCVCAYVCVSVQFSAVVMDEKV